MTPEDLGAIPVKPRAEEQPKTPPKTDQETLRPEDLGAIPVKPPALTPEQPTTHPIAEDQGSDPHDRIAALIAQGKSAGEAKAIVEGREPKTLTGKTPPAKPAPDNLGTLGDEALVKEIEAGTTPLPKEQTTPTAPPYQAYKSKDGQTNYFYHADGTEASKDEIAAYEHWQDVTEKRPPGLQLQPSYEEKPSTAPAAPSGPAHVEKPQKVEGGNVTGTATSFGLNYDGSYDPDDNGIGAFGGVNTRNPKLKAVAVPVDILEATFGHFLQSDGHGGYVMLDTPEAKKVIQAIRSAHVEALGTDGKVHSFPIVDIQGSVKGHPGKVLDVTPAAGRELGFSDNHSVSYQIVGGDGKLYAIDPDQLAGWNSGGGKEGGGRHRGAPPAPGEGQPAAEVPTLGGGGARPSEGPRPQPPDIGEGNMAEWHSGEKGSFSLGIGSGGFVTAAVLANALRGGKPGKAAPPEEEEEPGTAIAPYRAPMKMANVLGVKTVTPPPAAPGAAAKQLVAPKAALPAPPPAPETDPSVIKGLMKQGFTRQQALAVAAKATVTKVGEAKPPPPEAPSRPAKAAIPPPQIGTTAEQPPTRQVPLPPAPPPPSDLPAPKEQVAAKPPAPEAKPPLTEEDVSAATPKESAAAITRQLVANLKQHAESLADDDPRVRKQKDGMFKGEHFVAGDEVHDQAIAGLPGGHEGRQRQILSAAEQAIADKSPMHISYLSAPKEAEKFPTRDSRKVQYEEHSPEARLLGTTVGQLVGHSVIPVSMGIKFPTKAGELHQSYIQGLSTNVMANNFQHVNDKLASMGQTTPYEQLGPKFYNDLEGFMSNLNAGHSATGRGHHLGTDIHPNEPDTNHVPYKLTRKEADFIGTVINNTASFAAHDDAKALRELARANGTLITEKGETNRMRHAIEQHEPGWRQRVLEPVIRSFKTGLIHDVHPTEEHMPATIRPGPEFQHLTKALARTSYRGRPDIAIAASLHHTFDDNRKINEIEKAFSQDKITEAEARLRLTALGEDPDEFKFVSGSGGLVSPYEDDGEQLTPEEHTR